MSADERGLDHGTRADSILASDASTEAQRHELTLLGTAFAALTRRGVPPFTTFEIERDGERLPCTDLIAAVLTFGETRQQGRIDVSLLLDGQRAVRCWVEDELPHLAEFFADGAHDEVSGRDAAVRLKEIVVGARLLALARWYRPALPELDN